MNKDAVVQLKEMVHTITDVSNVAKKEMLELATLEMFDKVKAPLLIDFYSCRVQQYLKLKLPIAAKRTFKKLNEGQVDKKSKGPF